MDSFRMTRAALIVTMLGIVGITGIIYFQNKEIYDGQPPKSLTQKQFFKSLLSTDAELQVTGNIDHNIEGIINNMELVNSKGKQ